MPLGHMIEFVLVTMNTDGEEVQLSDFVTDPSDLTSLSGNHKDETIIRISGERRTPYMKWNTDRYEWQMIN